MKYEMAKWCATGAVAFGGMLATTSDASAALTWLANFGGQPSRNFAAVSGFTTLNVQGADAFLPNVFNAGAGSMTWSATTGAGFSIDAVHPGNQYMSTVSFRVFSIDEAVNASATLASAGSGGFKNFEVRRWDGVNWAIVVRDFSAASYAWSGTLGAGTYYVRMDWEANTTAFSGNAGTFSVPAPGAIALLGLAGLAGRRRR
jgi:MYXO-CTERM domain-containing protein